MIGIFLVTHGNLGESLIQCASHVLNRRPSLIAQLGVTALDDPADLLPVARGLVQDVDTGAGVVVLTDLFGSTPSNLASRLLSPGRVAGIAGVNVPMLLRALTYRDRDLETLVGRAVGGACEGVVQLK